MKNDEIKTIWCPSCNRIESRTRQVEIYIMEELENKYLWFCEGCDYEWYEDKEK